jgi:hypothetical protein
MWSVVIQDTASLKYLGQSGDWSHNLSLARNFDRIHDAAEYCSTQDIRGVHLVMGIPSEDGRFTATSKTILQVPRVRSWRATKSGSDALAS